MRSGSSRGGASAQLSAKTGLELRDVDAAWGAAATTAAHVVPIVFEVAQVEPIGEGHGVGLSSFERDMEKVAVSPVLPRRAMRHHHPTFRDDRAGRVDQPKPLHRRGDAGVNGSGAVAVDQLQEMVATALCCERCGERVVGRASRCSGPPVFGGPHPAGRHRGGYT